MHTETWRRGQLGFDRLTPCVGLGKKTFFIGQRNFIYFRLATELGVPKCRWLLWNIFGIAKFNRVKSTQRTFHFHEWLLTGCKPDSILFQVSHRLIVDVLLNPWRSAGCVCSVLRGLSGISDLWEAELGLVMLVSIVWIMLLWWPSLDGILVGSTCAPERLLEALLGSYITRSWDPVRVSLGHGALKNCHIAPEGTFLYLSCFFFGELTSLLVEFLVLAFGLLRVAPVNPICGLLSHVLLA